MVVVLGLEALVDKGETARDDVIISAAREERLNRVQFRFACVVLEEGCGFEEGSGSFF